MLSLMILLMLPILATSTIEINIQASNTYGQTRVQMAGISNSTVTEKDRELFKIRDWELKQAVFMYSGNRPDDVYVRHPTPLSEGDVYSRWSWPEVTRSIVPKRARVLDVDTSSVIVTRKHFMNRGHSPSVYSGNLSETADMTVKNTWITGGSYNFGEQVSYSISIGSGIRKSRSVSYSNGLGNGHEATSGISIGSDIPVQPILHPGQEVDVVLSATRGVVRVEVTYEATLYGTVATDYNSGNYKQQYFWGCDVNACLKAVGKPTKITFKEVIEVRFYYDENVKSS